MRCYLIYTNISTRHPIPYQAGLASIAAYLKAKGHEVGLSYCNRPEEADLIVNAIREFKPDVVGFTSVETQFGYAVNLARKIRGSVPCIILCGGLYATLFPEAVTCPDSPFDAAVIGEGERPMLQIAERIDAGGNWRSADSLSYRDSSTGSLRTNPLSPVIDDLDTLPHPALELFPYQEIIDKENMARFYFNRGCSYRCAYCVNAALNKALGTSSKPVRYRSVPSVIDEIESVLARYRLRDKTILHITDEHFISKRDWILEFCARYTERIGRPYWCWGRSNHITDEIAAALNKSGCVRLFIGVESGNDYIRNEVCKHDISRDVMFRSFEICHRNGIQTYATCMIGLPFETEEMIKDSIRTLARLKSVSTHEVYCFYPYKGTELTKICEERGYIPKDFSTLEEFREPVLDLPDLPRGVIRYYFKNWERLIRKQEGRRELIQYELRRLLCYCRSTAIGRKALSLISRLTSRFLYRSS